jgi:hypothetical protein
MTNEQKDIFQEKMRDKPIKQNNPTLSIDYYHPQPSKKPMNDNVRPLTAVPFIQYGNPDIPTSMGYGPYIQYQNVPQIINQTYAIQANGIAGGHQEMSMIFEDILPSRKFSPSYITLGERLDDHYFIRSTIFNNTDGDDINLDNGGTRSIMSHIKIDIGNVNPFNTYKLSNNPFMGLPYGYLIYRSCYPIRHNDKSGQVDCAKNSTGVNIRVYKMLEGSFLANKLHRPLFDYNEWREIAYYENIRENILKKKISPNFINIYGYFISDRSMIDYDKINNININKQKKEEPRYISNPEDNNIVTFNNTSNIQPKNNLLKNQKITTMTDNKKIIEVNPDAYLGKSLVILTESPTYSIFGWASKTYHKEGRINEMTGRGFKNEKEWMNVLFQLSVALYVMQLNNMYINDFNLEKNVFIKDLNFRGQSTEYWKYKVNGIDYYIANMGYLVMIDSNFLDVGTNEEFKFVQTNNIHKLGGDIYGDNNANINIKDKAFEMFKNSFNTNNFGKEFIRYGGVPPPPEVMSIIGQIMHEISTSNNKNIEYYIMKFMKRYINNRVGTYLKENEVNNVREKDNEELKKGDIMVEPIDNRTFKVVLLGGSPNNGQINILTKEKIDDKDYTEKNISVHSLRHYSKSDPIQQNFKPNDENFTEEGLLETYIVS